MKKLISEYNFLEIIGLSILFLFCVVLSSPFTTSTAPSIDSMTPANNSPEFLPVNLSVVATGDNSLNYTFHVLPGVMLDTSNATWAGGGGTGSVSCPGGTYTTTVSGTSFASPNSLVAVVSSSACKYTARHIIINQDTLGLFAQCKTSEETHGANCYFQVDGTTLGQGSSAGDNAWRNINMTLDTSAYNDGGSHRFTAILKGHWHSDGDTSSMEFWFPQFWTGEGTAEELSTQVQYSSETSYNIESLSSLGYNNDSYDPKEFLKVYAWMVNVTDSVTAEETVSSDQVLNLMEFSQCTTPNVLNYTILDEETQASLTSDLAVNFEFSTSSGSTSFNGNYSGSSNYGFCLNPEGVSITLNKFLQYQPEGADYSFNRFYFYTDATITGGTLVNTNLYAINDSLGGEVKFTVTLDGNELREGKIYVQKLNVGTGNYNLVSMLDTGANGIVSGQFQVGDAWYKLLIYDSNGVLLASFFPLTLSSEMPLNLFSASETTNYWTDILELRSLSYSFDYDNTTNISYLTYSDSSGITSTNCFRVTKINFTGQGDACYTCSTATASTTINCTILDQDATYSLQYITLFNGTYYLIDAEYLSLTQALSDLIGKDGLFYAFLLIGVLAFAGLFNPSAAVMFGLVGLILSALLGLVTIPITALVAIIAVGALIAFKVKT